MRTLHVIDTLGLGGAQRILKVLFEGSSSDSLWLFALRKDLHETPIQHSNVSIYKSSRRFSFGPLKELINFIDKYDIEILHCHLFRSQIYGWLLKLIYRPQMKLVFHEHGQAIGRETQSLLAQALYVWFLKYSARNVNGYIAISKAIQRKLLTFKCPTEKIFLLYNPVDFSIGPAGDSAQATPSISQKLKKQQPVILGFAGRLIKRKGWKELLNGMAILKESGNFILFVAGDGPERGEFLEQVKTLKLEEFVIYQGYIEDMDNDFYRQIDLLIVPSHWEPLGMIALEALSYGIPVVASQTDGLDEIIIHEETGISFQVKNERDMVEKILFILQQDKLRERISNNGRELVKKFNINDYCESLNKIYSQLD